MINNMVLYNKKALIYWSSFLALFLGYPIFANLIERNETWILFLAYGALWVLSLPWLIDQNKSLQKETSRWAVDLMVGLLLRLSLIFTFPSLSQDIFRFLWDGHLVANGISPYLLTPNELLESSQTLFNIPKNAQWMINKMGELSAGNHSSYPPITQWIFAIPHWMQITAITWQIVILRLSIIGADLGVYFLGRMLLRKLNLNPKHINWYFLNPFIILELTGNLHFEAFVTLSFLGCIWKLRQQAYFPAGILLGIGIGIKLIPLIFIPLIVAFIISPESCLLRELRANSGHERLSDFLCFFVGLLICTTLLCYPFFELGSAVNYIETIGLWFTKFEFNASIYYLLRWLGFLWKGYNLIAFIGPALSTLSVLIILYLSRLVYLNRCSLIQAMMWAILIYLLLATTVHPWYWTTVLIMSILCNSKIGLIGSVVIFMSYSAYQEQIVTQQPLWILLE